MNNFLQKFFVFLLLVTAVTLNAQNVGINATGAAPNGDALLDISSTNKGLLIPRVSIPNLTLIGPITGGATTSLLVYNTNATTGLGYHYWDGNDWIPFLTGASVDNGLYFNTGAGRVRLGGSLVENTTITQGAFGMVYNLDGTGDFQIHDAGVSHFEVSDAGRTTFGEDTYWRDVSTTGTIIGRFYDSGDDGIFQVYMNGGIQHSLNSIGTTVFNEQGGSYDFRIESNLNANCFFVDASADVIGFSGAPAAPFFIGVPIHEMTYPFEVGSDGGAGTQATIGYWQGGDVEILPETDWYGYVGNNTYSWYRMYSYGFVNVSAERKKRDITPINGNVAVENYVLNEIDKIQPYFYKYIDEEDELNETNYTKHRPMMHIGALVEESPDFIKDEAFSGIDIYGMSTLALVGVKANRDAIKKMQQNNMTITQDFGSVEATGKEMTIYFDQDFSNNIPVVTVTSNNPNVDAYVISKTNDKFVVQLKGDLASNKVYIDWMAMSKTTSADPTVQTAGIDDNLRRQLEVSNSKKQKMKQLFNQKSTLTRFGK